MQIIYPVERLDEAASLGRPLYLARTVDGVASRWHPSSAGPLVALQNAPQFEAPADSVPVGLNYGDMIELSAASIDANSFHPGDVVPLTLYWRALQQPDADYAVSLRLLDPQGAAIYQIDSQHPVLGMAPTSGWQPGEVVGDYYELQLPS